MKRDGARPWAGVGVLLALLILAVVSGTSAGHRRANGADDVTVSRPLFVARARGQRRAGAVVSRVFVATVRGGQRRAAPAVARVFAASTRGRQSSGDQVVSSRLRGLIARERPRALRAAARLGLAVADGIDGELVRHARGPLARVAASQSSPYVGTITDLGTLGGTSSAAGSIDTAGDVVGNSTLAGGANHAFLATGSGAGMADLGSLRTMDSYRDPVAGNSLAKSVNPSGSEVVGWSETNDPLDDPGDPQSYHATTWTVSHGVYAATDLGTLYAPANSGRNGVGCGARRLLTYGATGLSYAAAVNDNGTVVGLSDYYELSSCVGPGSTPDSMFPYFGHAFRWAGAGPMQDLGTLDNKPSASQDCAFSQANAENAEGAVVGFSGSEAMGGWGTGCSGSPSSDLNLIGHAMLLPAGSGAGGMIDLGEPAGGTGDNNSSAATAINASGDIAVNASSNDGVTHGYLYKNGAYTSVGSLGGSTALVGIDSSDDLVGWSFDANGISRAVAYLNGSLLDLNDVLPAGTPWFLERARAINDARQVAGTGLINGQEHAFRLTLRPYGVDIVSGPEPITAQQTASFEFSSPTDGATFECSLDGAAFAQCTSPQSYSALANGQHAFRVRALVDGSPPTAPAEQDWTIDTQPPTVTIDSAPSGTQNPPNATITFHGTSQDAADPQLAFTCQLDAAAAVPCDSPQTLTGLSDGPHTYSTSATDALGNTSSAPAVARWTVNTSIGPAALIDSQPPDPSDSPGATIAFHGNEPGLTFTCQQDTFPAYTCLSVVPIQLFGLTDGLHVFTITATDAQGNSSTPTVVRWTVSASATGNGGGGAGQGGTGGGGTGSGGEGGTGAAEGGPNGDLLGPGALPPESENCHDPAVASVSSGLVFVVGRNGTCLTRGTVDGLPVWKAPGTVTVNGITITPAPGSVVALSASAAGVIQTTGPSVVQLGGLPAVHVPVAFGWNQDLGDQFKATVPLVTKIAGLSIAPVVPSIELAATNGGTAKIGLKLTLPSEFKSIPGAPSGVGAEVTLVASNARGVNLAGKLFVGSLYLPPFRVTNLELGYDGASDTWSGGLAVALGAEGPQVALAATIGPDNVPALIGCCIEKFSAAFQRLNKPIPETPIFLQMLGLNASQEVGKVGGRQQSYVTFGGSAGVSLGPLIPKLGVGVVNIQGDIAFALSDPWSVTVTGSATLLKFPLANAKATYTSGAGVTLSGDVRLTIAGFGLTAAIQRGTFFEGLDRYNVHAVGTLTFPWLGSQQANVVFSSSGYAACVQQHGAGGNFALGWGVHADGTQTEFAGTCDMGSFTAAPSGAHTAAIGAPRTLTIGPHRGARLIAIHGAGAAPDITVTGPGGLQLAGGPSNGGTHAPAGMVIPDAQTQTTFIVLTGAPAGSYTLVSSNAEILNVSIANSLAPARPTVHTHAIGGGRRRLNYAQTTLPGQQLQLYEQGTGGSGKLLLTTTRARGSLTYTPAVGLGTHRSILAVTLRDGLPRNRQSLAAYTINDSPPPRVQGLIHHHIHHHSTLTWKPTPRAASYMLTFTAADGTTGGAVTATRTRTTIPPGSTRVTIVALDAIGRFGAPASTKLPTTPRPGHKRPPAHKRH
jgi:uncharacterized membrane protein